MALSHVQAYGRESPRFGCYIPHGTTQLTTARSLDSFVIVAPSSTSERSKLHRLIGAILLVFLVFLPLHYHAVTATSQVAKECSCVHGTRTQLVLHADSALVIPPLPSTVFPVLYAFSRTADWSRSENVRGPPVSL